MPRFDGTGPNGNGTVTGRKMGNCPDAQKHGCTRGFGRGMCRRYAAAEEMQTRQERIELLKTHKERIENEIRILENDSKIK